MMMYKLTEEQKKLLTGRRYTNRSNFNPVEDINGDWFISEEEIENCTRSGFEWLNELQEAEFVAMPSTDETL